MKNLKKDLRKHKKNLRKHLKNIRGRCLEIHYHIHSSDDWMDDMPMECSSNRYEFLVHVTCYLFSLWMLAFISLIIGTIRHVNWNEVYRFYGEIIREMLVWMQN